MFKYQINAKISAVFHFLEKEKKNVGYGSKHFRHVYTFNQIGTYKHLFHSNSRSGIFNMSMLAALAHFHIYIHRYERPKQPI